MPDRATILDYASPRPRGRLRLPANSVLVVDKDGDGVTIVETLKGRAGAVMALVFGALMTVPATATVIGTWHVARRGHAWAFDWLMFIFSVCVLMGLIVVGLMVIDQTWRKTILRAGRDGLRLSLRAPLRSSSYEWPRQYVGGIRIVTTQGSPHADRLGEVEIHLVDQPLLKLFTDHHESRLHAIAEALRWALQL